MSSQLETEALRLKQAALETLVAEYAQEARATAPLPWADLLDCQRPTMGDAVSLSYLRALRLLGWRDLFGPRLNARLLEQAGRRAAARLEFRDLDDILACLQRMMVGVPHVVQAEKDLLIVEEEECAVCSGLANIGEAVCSFEAGLLAGALEAIHQKPVAVVETKCWGLGDRVCRFEAQIGVESAPGPDPLEVIAALAARAAQASELLARLREREKELERLATTDELTGLCNRRVLYERMAAEIDRHLRYGHPLALLVLDLDNFKSINDTYGHQAGDQTLAAVGQVLRSHTRATDVAARCGGEEFAVLMPDTGLEGAAAAAERLRASVQRTVAAPIPLTVSIGVAAVPPCPPDADALMAAADAVLYEAKRAGKDRVVVNRLVNGQRKMFW